MTEGQRRTMPLNTLHEQGSNLASAKAPGLLEVTVGDINSVNDRLQDLLSRLKANNDTMFGVRPTEEDSMAAPEPPSDTMAARLANALNSSRQLLGALENEVSFLASSI